MFSLLRDAEFMRSKYGEPTFKSKSAVDGMPVPANFANVKVDRLPRLRMHVRVSFHHCLFSCRASSCSMSGEAFLTFVPFVLSFFMRIRIHVYALSACCRGGSCSQAMFGPACSCERMRHNACAAFGRTPVATSTCGMAPTARTRCLQLLYVA